MTDQKLIEAVKKNPDMFEEVVNRYWRRLFAFIRRTSYFSQEDIEDILQEVFLKVYRFLNDYDQSMSFSTWIYQIARNTVIDEIRKKKSRPQKTQMEEEEILKFFKSTIDVQKEVANADFLEKIRKIIFNLPLKYREVLVLRFLEEKNYEEIMDILKKPKGTIAALINRGRKIMLEKAREQKLFFKS